MPSIPLRIGPIESLHTGLVGLYSGIIERSHLVVRERGMDGDFDRLESPHHAR